MSVRQILYVDVPPLPYLHRYSDMSASTVQPSQRILLASPKAVSPAPLKRKPLTYPVVEIVKKRKFTPGIVPNASKLMNTLSTASQRTSMDNVNCHHCYQKRDPTACLQCTSEISSLRKGVETRRRCKAKFCERCLRKHYQLDPSAIRSQTNQNRSGSPSYEFKCPRCRGSCTCSRCRKSAKSASSRKQTAKSAASNARLRFPKLDWRPLETNLTLEEAESRIQIREFICRFASAMNYNISKQHLDELDDIAGITRANTSPESHAAWVSEACVRSIIIGLLTLLEQDSAYCKIVENHIDELRRTGLNLNKIWLILSDLRNDALSLPDPLPPPTGSTVYDTRSMRRSSMSQESSSTRISQTSQLIPVVEALIDVAITTKTIRAEIELGAEHAKDHARAIKECIKRENERFESERKGLEARSKEGRVFNKLIKAKRKLWRQRIEAIENIGKVVQPSFAPRTCPLGVDQDGRVFWAVSPSVRERSAAMTLLTSVSHHTLSNKRTCEIHYDKALQDEDRWSWFVGVWGKDPNPENEDEELKDTWWAVDEPEEIRKAADWIEFRAGSLGEDHTFTLLVCRLQEYATLLEWRTTGAWSASDTHIAE